MCGRFAQAQTRDEYLAYLADEADHNIAYDPEPIGRYDVAPGTKVLLLSERDEQLQLAPSDPAVSAGFFCTNDFTTGSAENLCLQGQILVAG